MFHLCLLIVILGTITVQGAGLRNSPIHFHAKLGECSVFNDNPAFMIKIFLFCKGLCNNNLERGL